MFKLPFWISIVITILHIWNLLEVLHQRNLKLESSLESVELPQGVKDHFALILLEISSGSKWNHQEFLVKFWWRSLSMVDGDLDQFFAGCEEILFRYTHNQEGLFDKLHSWKAWLVWVEEYPKLMFSARKICKFF